MVTPPTPNYDYDVKRLVKAYETALKDVQGELDSLLTTELKRAQVVATEKQIQAILSDLAKYGDEWAQQSLDKATLDGIASSMYALGATATLEEALALAKMSRTNRRLVNAAIADTQADLLAVTQNMNRQSKLAIRKATATAMRETLTKGDNATSQLSRAIRNEILKTPDMAIIDASGRRWKVGHYTDVIARTNMMNAHREASMVRGIEEGALYGRISRHGATDACAKWEGKIVKLVADADGDYPFIDAIPRRELFHPMCKHVMTPVRKPQGLSEERTAEVLNETNKPFNFVEAKNIKEVQTRLSDALGGATVNLGRMPVNLANDYLHGVEMFVSDFPEIKGFVQAVDTKTGSKSYGSFTLGANIEEKDGLEYLSFYNKLSLRNTTDLEKLIAGYARDERVGFSYKGTSPKTTAYHELVHALDRLIGMTEFETYKDGKFVDTLRTRSNLEYYVNGQSRKIVNEVKNELFGKEVGKEVYDGTKYLGKYSMTNSEEMLAEGVSYLATGEINIYSLALKEKLKARALEVLK